VDPTIVGIIGVAVFLILVVMGTWIGFAATVVGIVGITVIKGWGAVGGVAGFLPYSVTASFALSVIPLFIIMGYFAYYAGLTGDLYHTARQWVGHLPGGLAIATTFGAAAFGACTGSSTASAAVFGKVAIPEMKKYNYSNRLAAGSVATAGTLASMIPPSVVMVIYGILTEQSVGTLLIAGFIPGILQALLYSLLIYGWCKFLPSSGGSVAPASWKDRFIALKDTWGMLLLMTSIIAGLYVGIFTPTEAGGIGAFVALLMALGLRKLTWENLRLSLIETGKTTAMIFVTLVGVLILLRFLALSGITVAFTSAMISAPLPPAGVLTIIVFVYVILGMFVSATGMMMLTLPFVFPVITNLGYDPIWFGILVVTMCEIAFLTPPVAMNLYAVKSVTPDVPMEDIIKGVIPFLLTAVVFIIIISVFPQIVLWLPGTMGR